MIDADEVLDFERAEYDKLHAAALALYDAGRWELLHMDMAEQAKMWEDLRDALCLPKGHATEHGVNG